MIIENHKASNIEELEKFYGMSIDELFKSYEEVIEEDYDSPTIPEFTSHWIEAEEYKSCIPVAFEMPPKKENLKLTQKGLCNKRPFLLL